MSSYLSFDTIQVLYRIKDKEGANQIQFCSIVVLKVVKSFEGNKVTQYDILFYVQMRAKQTARLPSYDVK